MHIRSVTNTKEKIILLPTAILLQRILNQFIFFFVLIPPPHTHIFRKWTSEAESFPFPVSFAVEFSGSYIKTESRGSQLCSLKKEKKNLIKNVEGGSIGEGGWAKGGIWLKVPIGLCFLRLIFKQWHLREQPQRYIKQQLSEDWVWPVSDGKMSWPISKIFRSITYISVAVKKAFFCDCIFAFCFQSPLSYFSHCNVRMCRTDLFIFRWATKGWFPSRLS